MNILFKNLTEINDGFSKKKIFRKSDNKINKIIINFSENKSEYKDFLNIYEILNRINISIPQIYEVYPNKNIIVMEDLGDQNFNKLLNEDDPYDLLKIAVDSLIVIQNSIIYNDICKLQKYSFQNLKTEISEFVEYYIPFKKIINFNSNEFYSIWKKIFLDCKFEFKSFVHKDFELINLIFLKNNKYHLKCGIIDFQSAFTGFIGWDLFSILENPRINFTRKYNNDLIKYFYEKNNINIDFHMFQNQYYTLNLARLTRILGRWIKLFNQENDKKYLMYLKQTQIRMIYALKYIKNDRLNTIYKTALVFND